MAPTNHRYMPPLAELTTLPNGGVTNAAAQRMKQATSYMEPTADEIAPGVIVFGGEGFLNLTMVEGPEGVFVYDTGEHMGDGERLLAHIRQRTQKPIVAIVYSHSHYVHGTMALVEKDRPVPIIAHPLVNQNMANGGSGTLFAETAPLQIARTFQQFNRYAPESGPDAPAGAEIKFGRSGYLPATQTVQDGEWITIAGLKAQCFTTFGSDTDDCLSLWIPERGVVLTNLLWPFVPNIYTLRGSKFRDPREWADGLKVLRALKPTAIATTHSRAVVGADACYLALTKVVDGLAAIIDQTLRGILRGLTPDELRSFVRLPDDVAGHPNLGEYYGEVSHFGPYLYQAALGWFDGDAATINPLPELEQASRLVAAMGGRDKVMAMAEAALKADELAWAAQLVNYLFRLTPSDGAIRSLKATILRRLGQVTPGHTIRGWYIAQARGLEGTADVSLLVFPGIHILLHSPPGETVDHFRIRIDPQKAKGRDQILLLAIKGKDAQPGWHMRNGIAAYLAGPDAADRPADIVVETEFENWLRFFTCKRDLAGFLDQAQVTIGTREAAQSFFAAFDDLSQFKQAIRS